MFRIHKDIIMSRSDFFKTAFTGHAWQEANTNVMVLEDSDDTVVNIVVAWLYTGRLRYTPESQEAAQQVPLFSEGHGKKCCASERSKVDFEEPRTWCWRVILGIHTFADRYLLPSLRNDVLAVLSRCTVPVDDADLINKIWASTPRITGLKGLVLDSLVFEDDLLHDDNEEIVKELPTELLVELIRRLRNRLPRRLCEVCATKAAAWRGDKWAYDGVTIGERREVAPFDNDMCIYHDHRDDAERAVCKTEAEAKEKTKPKAKAEGRTRRG